MQSTCLFTPNEQQTLTIIEEKGYPGLIKTCDLGTFEHLNLHVERWSFVTWNLEPWNLGLERHGARDGAYLRYIRLHHTSTPRTSKSKHRGRRLGPVSRGGLPSSPTCPTTRHFHPLKSTSYC